MTKHIGRLIEVGIGVETVRGTAVAADIWANKTDFTFQERVEKAMDESSIGTIAQHRDIFNTKKWADGDIGGNVTVNQIGYYLLSMMGAVSSGVATTGAYLHNFDLAETNTTQSLTIAVKDPNEGDLRFPLACLSSLTISANEGEIVTFTATFMSQSPTSTTHTVTYTTDYTLLARQSIFKLATNLAGLDAGGANCIKSFEITFEKSLEADFCMGSLTPRDFLNGPCTITGSFTALYDNVATYKTLWVDNTKRAVRFQLVDTATTIGLSSNPTLTIDLPLVGFTEFDKDMSNDSIVTQTVNFEALYSNADGAIAEIALINTIEDYTA